MHDKHWTGFMQREIDMDNELTTLLNSSVIAQLPVQQQQIKQLLADHATLGRRYRNAVQPFGDTFGFDAQQKIDVDVRGMDRPTSKGIDDLVSGLEASVNRQFTQESQQVKDDAKRRNLYVLLGSLLLSALLLNMLYRMLKSLINALGAEPEQAIAATSRIAQGDMTERLNATRPDSLIGSLEMMQMRLRNITLAIQASIAELRLRSHQMPATEQRQYIEQEIKRLQEAADRIKVDRDVHQSPSVH